MPYVPKCIQSLVHLTKPGKDFQYQFTYVTLQIMDTFGYILQ